MKTIKLSAIIILSIISLTGCKDKVFEKYNANVPVYIKHNDLHKSINTDGNSQNLNKPGRIYFKDNYIYINEYYKGIHVIDNSDSTNPVNTKFIEIPGNLDLAIKGNILYANNAVDLVALDISDLENITEVSRLDSIFPYGLPEWDPDLRVAKVDESEGIVIDWKIEEVKEEILEEPYYEGFRSNTSVMTDFIETGSNQMSYSASSGSSNSTGIAGSMASFMIYQNTLYAIENENIKIIDITENTNPVFQKNFGVAWGIETLFSYEDKLFIGSQTGMYIYSLTNPETPDLISTYSHIRSCDPVVVSDDYAYVTLRSGTSCGGWSNQLDIIDISNLEYPSLIKSYEMTNPFGLGIDGETLFICDGEAGLKVYDVTTKDNIKLLQHFENINTFDVIPIDSTLIMIGNDGLYQYDYSVLSDIKLLSVLPIVKDE